MNKRNHDAQGRPYLGTPEADVLAKKLIKELGLSMREQIQDARIIIEMISEMGDDFAPEDLESAMSLANSWLVKYPDPSKKARGEEAVTPGMPLWGLLLMFGGAFVWGFLTG